MVDVFTKHGVILTAVGVYSVNTRDAGVVEARERVRDIVMSHEHVLQMHGFYIDHEDKTIRFDTVISFDANDRHQVFNELCEDVKNAFPDYHIQAAMDMDFSEI